MLQRAESSLVAVEDLGKQPWRNALAYPKPSPRTCKARVEELRKLGIVSVEFSGNVKIGNLHVLGKGCTSIVVKAFWNDGVTALKIRRTDSNRPSVERETALQRLANKAGVGAKVLASSKNLLIMELIEGIDVVGWIKQLRGKGSTKLLRSRLSEVLRQCFVLDSIGLDHGELSNLRKHVLIDERVAILDFETASLNRRVSNVTSAAQYLFIGGPVAARVRRKLGLKDVGKIIDALRKYKNDRSEETFREILSQLKLTYRN